MTNLTLQLFTPRLDVSHYEQERLFSTAMGTDTITLLQVCDIIRKEIGTTHSSKPHISFQIVRGFLCALATQDPNPLHYDIVRTTLNVIDPKLLKNTSAVDLLARHFSDFCKKLKGCFTLPKPFRELFKQCKAESDAAAYEQNIFDPPCLETLYVQSTSEKINSSFELNGMFLQDSVFLKVITSTGKKGSELAKEMKPACRKRLENYKKEGRNPLGFWFNLQAESHYDLFRSPCLLVLAEALWNDVVERLVHFNDHQVPALTTNIQQPIIQILSTKNIIRETNERLNLMHQDILIGTIPIATISDSMLKYVSNGCKKFRTVTGHRVIRYLIQRGFLQFANGHPDPRVIKLARGRH